MSANSSSSSVAAPDQARSIETRLQALEAEVQFLRTLVFAIIGMLFLAVVAYFVPAVQMIVFLALFAAIVVFGVVAIIRSVQFLLNRTVGSPL
jgi:hypothetical protein